MQIKRVLILGGTGFIGRAIAEQFSKRGMELTVPTRDRDRAKHLLVLPACDVVVADIFNRSTLQNLLANTDCVVNLVGILHGDFDLVHVQFPKLVAELCVANNTPLAWETAHAPSQNHHAKCRLNSLHNRYWRVGFVRSID